MMTLSRLLFLITRLFLHTDVSINVNTVCALSLNTGCSGLNFRSNAGPPHSVFQGITRTILSKDDAECEQVVVVNINGTLERQTGSSSVLLSHII